MYTFTCTQYRNVSVPLMLAKLAMELLSLNFVDAKQCCTVHAQLKTNMRGQKMACVVLVALP